MRKLGETSMLDDQQFNEWFETCLPRVRAQCYRILHNWEDADDATVETFLKAYHYFQTYRPDKAAPLTWLMVIAKNVCISMLRRRDARPVMEELPEHLEDPERPVEIQVESLLAFEAAMACLAPEERVILVGKSLEGYTWEELARDNGTTVARCRGLHLLACRKIREKMKAS